MMIDVQHKKQWQQLLKAYQQNRLSHAYVLSGPLGLGKNDFASAFAAFLLCDHHDVKTGEPCQQCVGCQWMRAKTHPDFFHIKPTEKNHSIKIDQIRELIDKLTRKSQRGAYQVVILSPADAMPLGAANALLKTLEEPAGKTIFLLVSDQVDQLPATMRSRCQSIVFQGIRYLSPEYLSLQNNIIAHFVAVLEKKDDAIVSISGWLKHDVEWIFDALLTLGVDLSKIQCHVSSAYMTNPDQLAELQSIARKISVFALQRWIQLVLEKKKLIAQGMNLNTQLLFENLMIAWESLNVR